MSVLGGGFAGREVFGEVCLHVQSIMIDHSLLKISPNPALFARTIVSVLTD